MSPIKPSRKAVQLLGRVVTYAILLLFTFLTLVPLVWMFISSFKSEADFFTSLFLPSGDGFLGVAWGNLTLDNYRKLIEGMPFVRYMLNSFFIAGTVSVVGTLFAAMGGYALAKFRFPGQTFLTAVVLGALIVPGVLLLAPGYQVIYFLGLLDTHAGIILPMLSPAFGVFLFRQAMLNAIPGDLLESARMEGCNELQIFFLVVLPLVRPMAGAFVLLTFLGAWNNFITPSIILQSEDLYPIALGIVHLRGLYGDEYGAIMAGTVIAISPVVILFFFLQKEFISGLTSGAVKG
mgnify:CR=1 FL=1